MIRRTLGLRVELGGGKDVCNLDPDRRFGDDERVDAELDRAIWSFVEELRIVGAVRCLVRLRHHVSSPRRQGVSCGLAGDVDDELNPQSPASGQPADHLVGRRHRLGPVRRWRSARVRTPGLISTSSLRSAFDLSRSMSPAATDHVVQRAVRHSSETSPPI